MEIVPAVLTDDPKEFDELLRRVRDSKKFKRVQIDFIDGEYAVNKTIRPLDCDLIPYHPIKFDAQLMVTESNLWEYVRYAQKIGFDRIIPQAESISEPEKFDCLAMDFHSPVAVLAPYLVKLKYVLVMSVEPGFGGQEFVKEAIEDIKSLSHLRQERGYKFLIGVDGGIKKEHLQILEEAGADEVAVGVERVLNW